MLYSPPAVTGTATLLGGFPLKFIRSAIVVATAALVPFVPSAAQADAYGHADSTGDLHSVVTDSNGKVTDTTSTAEPTATLGDVTSVRATNRARYVKVVMHYVDLHPAGIFQVHEVMIATRSKARVAMVAAYPGKWGGKAMLRTLSGKKVACSISHNISYAKKKVVIKVPQSCLGHAKVVKVGAATLIADGSKIFFDDAYTAGGLFTDPFVLSPRIHR